ncbi:MAG: hypothetical protein GX595_01690 [Lentisphaerae bacterium]|nr:hypothetical protein [Lentisphaerota bacterium]
MTSRLILLLALVLSLSRPLLAAPEPPGPDDAGAPATAAAVDEAAPEGEAAPEAAAPAEPPPGPEGEPAPEGEAAAVEAAAAIEAAVAEEVEGVPAEAAPAAAAVVPAPAPSSAAAPAPAVLPSAVFSPAPTDEVTPAGDLRLNFRAVPVDVVLDYLSRAGGFVIVREAPISGTLDIVSHNPVTPDEAVAILHHVLGDQGYGVVRNDRLLRIVRRDDARQRNLPVVSGNDPAAVPATAELVTHIVSLRHTTAVRLVETLKPILPTQTTLTANADSNALVITDTRANIRRMLEIIQALDTAVSSILDIGVIPLRYADAVETADLINKVYETPTSRSTSQTATNRGGFMARMAGIGGAPGGADASQADTSREARATASFVRAVADQNGNAVVVTAPSEVLVQIRELIRELDAPTEDSTSVRVLPLRYADATEVANHLARLYPDTTSASSRQSSRARFFGPGGPMAVEGASRGAAGSASSQRKLAEAKVIAVADTRTNAVIVSASATSLEEITRVVAELDATPINVPTVHVYQLQNADVSRTKEILESMFDDLESTSGSRSSSSGRTTTTRNATTGTGTSTQGRTTARPGTR